MSPVPHQESCDLAVLSLQASTVLLDGLRCLRSLFTKTHTAYTTFTPGNTFYICYFKTKQGDGLKLVVDTQESKPKGCSIFVYDSYSICWMLCIHLDITLAPELPVKHILITLVLQHYVLSEQVAQRGAGYAILGHSRSGRQGSKHLDLAVGVLVHCRGVRVDGL